ncbi:TadE/TadG family type IV pilus assembly protein [Streptomyces indicus]|uniref:TadE-like protein n=1 Tax=Streptomyces indicus TaxID=417292 RepID=A0A1G9BJH7_9ACTN|nr:TadE/TadG family type IV pilus assembly protein [Streptomyces indicus]SDK39274.1 TadE-like protein [Streptomyces indicus]
MSNSAPPAFEAILSAPAAFEQIRTKSGCGGPGAEPPVSGRGGAGRKARRRRHAPAPENAPTPKRTLALKSDKGAAILEFTGFLPTLLLIGLACIQLGLVGYTFSQAGSAARAAARAASLEQNADAAGRAAMSDWLADGASISAPPGATTVTATVEVDIPELIPFVDMGWTATRTVTMPMDD